LFNSPYLVDFAVCALEKKEASSKSVAKLFDWLIHVIPSFIKDFSELSSDKLDDLLTLADANCKGELVSTKAKHGVKQLIEGKTFDAEKFIGAHKVVTDTAEIERIVKKVIDDNQKAAEDVKNGEMKAIGFLVGQVMKESKGKANPNLTRNLIKKQLGV
jgi:aspartyl-tRNA(Asn)/glutamyl-tRNA(Gln) amidotransferase subunit B